MKAHLFLIASLTSTLILTQVQHVSGNFQVDINAYIQQIPGDPGNAFSQPSAQQLETWNRALQEVDMGNYPAADERLDSLDYELV